MSTALRSVGLFDVLSSTRTLEYGCDALGRALLAKRRIPARLRHFATRPGEKSGLALPDIIQSTIHDGFHSRKPRRLRDIVWGHDSNAETREAAYNIVSSLFAFAWTFWLPTSYLKDYLPLEICL